MKKSDPYNKIIDFYKLIGYYDKEMFDFIFSCISYVEKIDHNSSVKRDFIDEIKEDRKLIGFNIRIPKITNKYTLLINIYAITHAINLYRRLGKRYKTDKMEEILPVTLVRIFASLYFDGLRN